MKAIWKHQTGQMQFLQSCAPVPMQFNLHYPTGRRNSEVKPRVCEPWPLRSEKMKDIDIGKEYIIPSPGYRNVSQRTSTSGQQREREESKYKRSRPVECQDALETAARAEGLSLDVSVHSQLRILDEEHPRGKYHHGLSVLKPIRTTSKHQHPVDNAGLFSCMTFSWLTSLARVAYKKGELLMEDVWPLSKYESSDVNCRRLERLWQEELNEVGPDAASLRRVVWIFCRTRLILSIVCLMITQLAGFSGPNFQDGCVLRSE
ncbi:ATP-binding cassette sub-family C member 5 isoform X4 [Trichechus manatus latirostris]|uniref:ATP-binding cassette sub-family C member 5 isoform X4 n=1 Tax=Trichechus manatus latirostris TaxID=127582 RepID=A0A2Y9DXQ0_TRIMA|nr:ATP-binding cassette sub-family C member 5 isoform X4 [Trichechus manatus latirostris]XP_023592574.1 ATP-binding cassette sub-family C member 5 isoform X4 [Trichechus manatus latirostris]